MKYALALLAALQEFCLLQDSLIFFPLFTLLRFNERTIYSFAIAL